MWLGVAHGCQAEWRRTGACIDSVDQLRIKRIQIWLACSRFLENVSSSNFDHFEALSPPRLQFYSSCCCATPTYRHDPPQITLSMSRQEVADPSATAQRYMALYNVFADTKTRVEHLQVSKTELLAVLEGNRRDRQNQLGAAQTKLHVIERECRRVRCETDSLRTPYDDCLKTARYIKESTSVRAVA